MDKVERKIVFFLLLSIIILSCFLVYKIKSKQKYDKELYNEIYTEYEQLFKSNEEENKEVKEESKKDNTVYIRVNSQGVEYRVIGEITIPKISIKYPIIYETSEEYLKIAPTKLFGPDINEVGNLCIVGHNFKNKKFFSRLSELDKGDIVLLSANIGQNMEYVVYDKYEIDETDMSCTNQNTNGNIELTLITCANNKKKRLVVKCKAKFNK